MKRSIERNSFPRLTVLGLGIVLLAACTDRMPLAIDAAAEQTVEAQADVAAASIHYNLTDRSDTSVIDDVVERILPALTDEPASKPLIAALAGLRNALDHSDHNAIPALIEAARNAVNRYARGGNDGADLDVIRLTIDQIADTYAAAR